MAIWYSNYHSGSLGSVNTVYTCVAHACNPSTEEMGVGGLKFQGHL